MSQNEPPGWAFSSPELLEEMGARPQPVTTELDRRKGELIELAKELAEVKAELNAANATLAHVRSWAEGNLRHEFHPSGLMTILDRQAPKDASR